jgi:hypothetical protein
LRKAVPYASDAVGSPAERSRRERAMTGRISPDTWLSGTLTYGLETDPAGGDDHVSMPDKRGCVVGRRSGHRGSSHCCGGHNGLACDPGADEPPDDEPADDEPADDEPAGDSTTRCRPVDDSPFDEYPSDEPASDESSRTSSAMSERSPRSCPDRSSEESYQYAS